MSGMSRWGIAHAEPGSRGLPGGQIAQPFDGWGCVATKRRARFTGLLERGLSPLPHEHTAACGLKPCRTRPLETASRDRGYYATSPRGAGLCALRASRVNAAPRAAALAISHCVVHIDP